MFSSHISSRFGIGISLIFGFQIPCVLGVYLLVFFATSATSF